MQINLNLLNDEELMDLYCQGQSTAFDILYNRYASKLYGYLRSKTHAELADELIQEVFLKIHNSRHLYSRNFPVIAWFFTICKNVFIDSYRKSKNERNKIVELIHNIPSEVQAEFKPDASNIEDLLVGITENQKQALLLKYEKDWSFEQIAKRLNTSPENARQLVSRAIKKLRHTFSKKMVLYEKN